MRSLGAMSCALFLATLGGCTADLGLGQVGELGGSAGTLGPGDPEHPTSTPDRDPEIDPADPQENPYIAPTTFSCDAKARGASPPLRRLTRVQYLSTLRDLLTMALGEPALAADLMESLREETDKLRDDVRIELEGTHSSYRRLDQAVQQSHVDVWFALGRRVGELLSTSELLPKLLGSCAESSSDQAEACIDGFISRFGRLALRRPLSSDEVEFYRTFYEPSTGIDEAGIVDVVTGFLNAPQFLYIVEHGADPVDEPAETYELNAYELASRLSYHFWNSMPDEELLDLAESGELLEKDVYRQQVERLWVDERTHATVSQFFLEWLSLEDVPELDRNNEATVFQNFAGADLPSSTLRSAMIDEAIDLLNFYTWDRPQGMEEIFLTPYSFARSEELADLYGTEPWDGGSDPPELSGDRPGLLTRAAFLSTGTANTRPIMKGVFIRTNVLCDHIPPPPENAAAQPPELSPELTTREVVEALTSVPGCRNCHESLINPLGFATEAFDSLGRYRTEQLLFDEDGEPLGSKKVHTQSVPQVILGDTSVAEGPGDLMELIASSGKVEACFARHYFRFTFGRQEGVATDGCVLEEMRSALEENGSIADMLRAVALSDSFMSRTFVPVGPKEEN